MAKKELEKVTKEETEAFVIEEAKLPDIVTSQVEQLQELETKVIKAMESAKNASEKAEIAHERSAGIGHKKVAIESLQDALLVLADAEANLVDAQKVSFEYQKKLGEITKYLFGLGVSNIAANRTVVRQLELKMSGASKEQLGELAKQEILNVIRQLKNQENIMSKQEILAQETKKLSQEVAEGKARDARQDEELEAQAVKDAEHDRLISEQAAKDAEHDRLISEQADKDAQHDQLLSQQAEALTRYGNQIAKLEAEVETLKAALFQKASNVKVYISLGVAAVAIVLSMLRCIL